MKTSSIFAIALALAALAPSGKVFAQDASATPSTAPSSQDDPKQRTRTIRDQAKRGEDGIAAIAPFVGDPDVFVRVEAVKGLVAIGGPKTVDSLVRATSDGDAEVQIRATDGLVNVYLPGYVKTGLSGTLSRVGSTVRGKFTDTNDQVIEPFVQVPPEVIAALGKLARGGTGPAGTGSGGVSLDARADAARAIGVLRGRAAIPDLVEALRSKDDKLMYESLVAIGKIGDPTAAPRISFLLRDLNEKVQAQALEVTGILRNRDAAPRVREAFQNARGSKIKRAALESLAMLADPADHALFVQNLSQKDEGVRAAAAEGVGRLGDPADLPMVEPLFNDEHGMSPRISQAFALVALGNLNTERYSALRYLVNTLNQRLYRSVASALLIELARRESVRRVLYPLLTGATKDEKLQMSIVLAQGGQADSVPYLETLSKDPDPDVATEGIRSLRVLRARLQ